MTKHKEVAKQNVIAPLNAFKEQLFKEAETIVMEGFPKKVIEFDNMIKSHRFSYDRLPEIMPDIDNNIPIPPLQNGEHGPPSKKRKAVSVDDHEIAGTPVYAFLNGTVKCNDKLADLMDQMRPLLREAVEDVNKVKMWITLLIPRIEDGNNFGVSIQEETLGEVRNVESEAASFLDQMSRYFTSRGKLITKIAKYPHVDDYRRAILDMDEKQFLNIRLVILEMRNHFSTLHDVITKNLEKIKKPRNSNMDHLY